MADVKPIPDNYPRLAPYLCVDGAAAAIDWYKSVLGARQRGEVMTAPGGKVGHAELEFGSSVIMLADEWPDEGVRGPKSIGGSPVTLHLYVQDSDAVVAHAEREGATVQRKVEDRFYGDRSGQIIDPFGHIWNISTHIEDVPPEEMARRAAAEMGG